MTPVWAVNVDNIFGWFMFALITGLTWNAIGYPFRRWFP